jgi:hypothetical protein
VAALNLGLGLLYYLVNDGLIVGSLVDQESRLYKLFHLFEIKAGNGVNHIAFVNKEQGWD